LSIPLSLSLPSSSGQIRLSRVTAFGSKLMELHFLFDSDSLVLLGTEFECVGRDFLILPTRVTFNSLNVATHLSGLSTRHSAFLREIWLVARSGRPAWDPVGGYGWVPSHTTKT
jgi:hypothetical protein